MKFSCLVGEKCFVIKWEDYFKVLICNNFFYVQELNEFWGVNTLLEVMVKKLSYTASLELVPLMEVPGVKQVNIELFSKSVAEQLLYTEKNNAGKPPRMRVRVPSSSLFLYIRTCSKRWTFCGQGQCSKGKLLKQSLVVV